MPIAIYASFLRAAFSAIILSLLAMAPAAAQTVGGYTNMSRDTAHGTQIEYLSTRGEAFLWYPGNSVILQGRWKRDGSDICFAYGGNTYNPATGQRGGGWECMPFRLQWGAVVERMPGDILGLAQRREVPFRLGRGVTTLEKVLARVSPRTQAPPVELPAISSDGNIVLSCEAIIANAERSRDAMASAAFTYFHGVFMGKPCVAVDYDRAFDLAGRSGLSVEPFVKILRERAADGHPTAIAALRRLGY